MKDYWCARHPNIHPELETYEKFRTAETPPYYVAHALGGGHVRLGDQDQVTLTQHFLEKIWTSSSVPSERFHYRLVLQEIGRPLDTFKDSAQLVYLIYEAFLGVWHKIFLIECIFSWINQYRPRASMGRCWRPPS